MARAAGVEASGMAALIGADPGAAERISEGRRSAGGRLQVANINAPGQVVVAGGEEDIEWLSANAADLGLRRVIPLNVAGAFHSEFMAPARDELAGALGGVPIGEARFPVWSNTTALPHQTEAIGDLLPRQLVEPVLFSDTLLDMSRHGIETFVHVGPGDVTAGLARKTVEGASVHVISKLEDLPSVLDVVGTMHRS
jgi:[acyl-carrier-protein] S-malonyltransferase